MSNHRICESLLILPVDSWAKDTLAVERSNGEEPHPKVIIRRVWHVGIPVWHGSFVKLSSTCHRLITRSESGHVIITA
jgi:hypothetical protein